ncbi:MAG: thioesterase family protein [Bacteriovoracaceae bacterium]|nr:acyl-CoA thioesterase [Bacteroidota bacterium]
MSKSGVDFTTDIRVRYAETDGMKVVYHGNYLTYFEEARTNLFRNIGIVYTEIERAGFFLVVVEAHAHYRRSAIYDDILHVKASLKERPSMKLTIDYEITRNSEPEILATGQTVHAFLDAQSGKPIRPPQEYINIMQRYFLI